MRRSARERRAQYSSETGVVAALTHKGAGIVHEGKTAFVAGALPGEQIRFRRQRSHGQHDEALLEEVLSPSAERVAPRCRHFDVCGGCALQHLDGAAQLRLKEQQLRDALRRIGRVSPLQWLAPVSGPSYGYRRRARLGVKYVERKERVLVGFRERNSNLIAAIERCEVLAPPVDGLIAPLCTLIAQLSIRTRLPQIEVATGDDAVVLVLRVLDPPSETDLELLRAFQTKHAVRIHLQPGGIDSIRPLNAAEPALSYRLPEAQLTLEFRPTDFVQINAAINQTLVGTAVDLLQLDSDSRVLDLFCGLGNFSLAMARRASEVVGVEGDSGMVERARGNAQRNGLTNVQFHSADLFADVRSAPWLAGTYSHVLLDPPRAGASDVLPAVAQLAPRRLLYVSCHPATLARDVGLLVHEHGLRLLAAGVVDMFPHTAHVESMALLAP